MNTLHTIKKFPTTFILGSMVAWFTIGLIVSYFVLFIPFFHKIEFFNDMVSLGSLLGTSTITAYVESTAGVSAGGRTGLTAIVAGVLFILALIISNLTLSISSFILSPRKLYS